jgi:hypothetical protein
MKAARGFSISSSLAGAVVAVWLLAPAHTAVRSQPNRSPAQALDSSDLSEDAQLSDTEFFKESLDRLFNPNGAIDRALTAPNGCQQPQVDGFPRSLSQVSQRMRTLQTRTYSKLWAEELGDGTLTGPGDCVRSARSFLTDMGLSVDETLTLIPQLRGPFGNSSCRRADAYIGARCKGLALLNGVASSPEDIARVPGKWKVTSNYSRERNGIVFFSCPNASSLRVRRYGHVAMQIEGKYYDNTSRPDCLHWSRHKCVEWSSPKPIPVSSSGAMFGGICAPVAQVYNAEWSDVPAPSQPRKLAAELDGTNFKIVDPPTGGAPARTGPPAIDVLPPIKVLSPPFEISPVRRY